MLSPAGRRSACHGPGIDLVEPLRELFKALT
jgi:hypothetical protein